MALTVSTTSLFKKGATSQMTATATMSTGTTQDVTSSCTGWASDATGVATIGSSGLVTAVGSGSATITATCSAVFARLLTTLTVATKAIPTVALSSTSLGYSSSTPFLPHVIFKVWYGETSKAFGYNVNFMTFTIRNASGSISDSQNFGPDMFINGSATGWKAGDPYLWPAWQSNHIDASGLKYACFVSTSWSTMPSSVTLTWATQLTDDQNVVSNSGATTTLTPLVGSYSCDTAAAMSVRGFGPTKPSQVGR